MKYTQAVLEIIRFSEEDVIVTSSEIDPDEDSKLKGTDDF